MARTVLRSDSLYSSLVLVYLELKSVWRLSETGECGGLRASESGKGSGGGLQDSGFLHRRPEVQLHESF